KTILCLHISKQMSAERSIKFMDMTSRRTFLKLAALAAPSATTFGSLAAWGLPSDTSSGKPVQAWRTSEKARCQQIEAPAWQNGAEGGPETIQLDPGQQFQELLGFGAALTDASCYLLQQMPAAAREALLNECFGADGLRMSIARTTIGSSD